MTFPMIVIRWNEPDIRGYADHLSARLLQDARTVRPSFEHRVTGPRGGEYRAKCAVLYKAEVVDLDYSAFAAFNTRRGIDLGVLRLVFTDAQRESVKSVAWKERGSKQFRTADVSIEDSPPQPGKLEALYEGAVRRMLRNSFERNATARRLCTEAHGTSCSVCGFDFGQTYGPLADGYIHVHHLKPLSARRRRHAVDPVADLRPVCANCHAAIHLRNPEFTLEGLRELMATAVAGAPPNKALQPTRRARRQAKPKVRTRAAGG